MPRGLSLNRAQRIRCARTEVLTSLLIFAAVGSAAIFPDQIGDFKKGPVTTVAVPDQGLYAEYGLDATETAEYAAGPKHFTATAWRMRDSTGAMALFESRRPPGAVASTISKLAVSTSDGVIFAYGNYVFRLTGSVPPQESLEPVYAGLPKLENSPLPALMTELPPDGLVANSERYVLGPVSLERFEPRIAPSVAAFHLGTEGQIGTYRTLKGPLTLAIFHYPGPGFAGEREREFQKIPGAMSRRVGSLVAVTIAPPDADEAERILSRVRYDTNLTLNEKVPISPENEVKGKIRYVINTFIFAGILMVGCLVAGVAFGGFRTLRRKFRRGEDPEAMIKLHLS
jgi:hypothetical protein